MTVMWWLNTLKWFPSWFESCIFYFKTSEYSSFCSITWHQTFTNVHPVAPFQRLILVELFLKWNGNSRMKVNLEIKQTTKPLIWWWYSIFNGMFLVRRAHWTVYKRFLDAELENVECRIKCRNSEREQGNGVFTSIGTHTVNDIFGSLFIP